MDKVNKWREYFSINGRVGAVKDLLDAIDALKDEIALITIERDNLREANAAIKLWQNFVRTYQPHVAKAADEELLGKESEDE